MLSLDSWTAESVALPFPLQRAPLQQIFQLQLRRLLPIQNRLDEIRRQQRQPQHSAEV